ncbi:MAG: rhodanese-like domain-containing protein [Saprospiraceae bacterium]|nr:rhodanese-like domain-containing protein [Saprospiraceae bacterium]
MALNVYYKILILWCILVAPSFSQETVIQCVNPEFDQLVDQYLNYSVPTISVADAFESRDKFIFLDARETNEYNTSHIEKAVHIGYNHFNIEALNSKFAKDTPLIVYCSIGYRSEKIGEILKKNGFHKVYNLYGSIFEWVNQHHPIVDKGAKPTDQLHTYNKKWGKWVQAENIQKSW